mmetsp:Transcript_15464/g.25767  ORF Transcript_15464/g.25767 Transcript_15464/m.25767 type:complete len:305 (+) Transcript_15464:837-1751(+)
MLKKVLPRLLKPISTDPVTVSLLQQNQLKPIFDANQTIVSCVTQLGLLLTFGAAFPPLAVAFFLSMSSTILFNKVKIGRFVTTAIDLNVRKYAEIVESECRRAGSLDVLRQLLWLLLAFSCCFYAFLLFDTLGGAVGFQDAFWVLVVVPLLPGVYYLSHKVLRGIQQQRPASASNPNPNPNPSATNATATNATTTTYAAGLIGVEGIDGVDVHHDGSNVVTSHVGSPGGIDGTVNYYNGGSGGVIIGDGASRSNISKVQLPHHHHGSSTGKSSSNRKFDKLEELSTNTSTHSYTLNAMHSPTTP